MNRRLLMALGQSRRSACQLRSLVLLLLLWALPAAGQGCFAPARPFVPSDIQDVRRYADLLRKDFETYLTEVQEYFRCLDAERARAFAEAEEVAQEYGRFQNLTSD